MSHATRFSLLLLPLTLPFALMKSRFSVSSTVFALVFIAASLAMALELGNAEPVHAATPDDYTADTTTTGAVAVGGFASGEIEALQDVDWFAVTLEAGKTYYFTAWGTEIPYYLGTLYMPGIVGLYDSSGTEIAGTRKGGVRSGRTDPQWYLASADGVHYVAVTGVGSSGWALGTYTLVVAESPADDCVEGVTTTCLVSVGGSFTGNIQWTYDNNPWTWDNNPFKHPQDVDWIRANLTAGKTYRFTLEGADAGKGTLKRPSLYQALYYVNDEGKVAALSFQESVKAPHSGAYYIQVEGDGQKEQGTYTLTLTEVSGITDDFPDDTTTTGTVTVSDSVDQGLSCLGTTGNIEVSRDVDWFSVQLEAGKNYLFFQSGAYSNFHCAIGSTRNSHQLKGIYDSAGVPVTKAAYYNPFDSLITFQPSSSGTYYVAAGGRHSRKGAYRVAVGRLPDDDYSADTGTAGSLAVDGTASGTLQTFSDVDWFAASLTAGQSYLSSGGITEGGSASFTVSASPPPAADLDVSVTVSQSGDYGAATGQRTVTVPTTGSATFTVDTTDDQTDEADGSLTATVNAGSDYTVSSTQGAATVSVADNDGAPTPEISVTGGGGITEGGSASFTVSASPAPAASLDVKVTVTQSGDYGATTGQRTVTVPTSGSVSLTVATTDDQVDETDGSVTATVDAGAGYTVSSSQGAATVTVADNDDGPDYTDYQTLVDHLIDIRDNPANTAVKGNPVHIRKWNRVLAAIGYDSGESPMPESEIHANAARWPESSFKLASDYLKLQAGQPVVSVSGGSGITEGGSASFTVSASPAPSSNLDVKVTVTQSGDYGATTGQRTVTIPTSGSVTFTVATTDDGAEETDGSVTATVNAGSGYTVSSSQGAATVSVADNDDPKSQVSITGSVGGSEGESVSFTISANPAPKAALPVSVTVATTGDFGFGSAPASLTIPTSGSVTLTITTTNDKVDEPDGSVTLTLNAGSGYTLGTTSTESVQVTDDDEAGLQTIVVSIAGGNDVAEGGDASFTVSASPAPASDLDVSVTITQSGEYGATTGQRTVTVPTSGSVSFTVATTDDSTDETDGSVTATLVDGADYDLGPTKTATVTVSDNDDAPPDYTDYQTVVDYLIQVRDNPANTAVKGNPVHIKKWNRVLAAIGYDSGESPMPESEIHANAARWPDSPFKAASVYLNSLAGQPEISVTGGAGITEGGSASFTVSANPAPSASLNVKVTVSQSGDYGATTGQRTVTVPTSGSVSFTVATTDDSADETDGSVTATVDAGTGYTVSSSQGAATVSVSDNDDAPTPEVSVSGGAGITEGGSASFTVSASPAPSANLDVKVTVTQSGDYGATTGQRTVTIPTTGSVTFTVATTDDSADEADGSVTATVNAGSGYTVSSSQSAVTVTVADNDDAPPPTPEISVTGGGGITEGGSASFTVSASPAPSASLDVKVTVTQSGDYGATTGQRTVTVPTSGSVTFTVGTTDDSTDEADGSVTATVNASSAYTVSSTQGAATVSVSDNDDAPKPVVSVTGGSGITEGGSASFTVSASPAPASNLDVSVTVSQSGDYGAATGQRTVTIPTTGSVTFTVGTTDDSADETDGSVTATVNAGSAYTVSSTQGAATVSVSDNDDASKPEVSISGGSEITEGGSASFTVSASPAPAANLDVSVTVSQSGDYGAATGQKTVTIPTTGSVAFTVGTTDDSTDEADGSVTATLDTPAADAAYTVSATQGAATVSVSDNDDAPEITVTVEAASAVEGENLVFRVRLSAASAEEIRVRWSTAPAYHLLDDRAHRSDYEAAEGELVFKPGVTELTGEVWLTEDEDDEPDEYFAVEAYLPGSLFLPDAVGTMTIVDND